MGLDNVPMALGDVVSLTSYNILFSITLCVYRLFLLRDVTLRRELKVYFIP